MSVVTIGRVSFGQNIPCRFVAELSCNHGGDWGRMQRLIHAAKGAGADMIKTQTYLPSELVDLRGDGPAPAQWGEQGFTMRSLYERAKTPFEWLPRIAAEADAIGLPWFTSVFGVESFAAAHSAGAQAYKIAALDSKNEWLFRLAGSTGRPLIASSPERWPQDFLAVSAWLFCPRGYPTLPASVHLPDFQDSRHVGLSSHCLDRRLPIAAVARGAKLIEMHFMLAEEPGELETNISLTQYQFREMVDDVRATEEMLA